MLINALNAIAEFLIRILKGLITFCEEFIPLLLKNALCISPFILSVVLAYKLGGARTAVPVAVIVILLMGVGISWAVKKKIQDRRLTGELIAFILIIDIILVLLFVFQIVDIEKATGPGRSKPQAVVDNRQEEPFANVPESFKIKEGEFLALLKDAISNNEYSDIIRAIDELKRMNCKSLKPLAISALEKYHPNAKDEFLKNSKYKVCVECIEALAIINAKGVCQVLYKVQARQPDLYNTVEKAANKICK